ncbi:MAG: hypothetical protein KC656_28385, partial [Myxococcales bacterium]|nr:hypothetical protein [Myxococcales bacterium]
DDTVLRLLHHEMTHLIACDHPFDEHAWRAVSDDAYVGDVRNVGDVALPTPEEAVEAGFITPYAMTTPWEDLAETLAVSAVDREAALERAEASPTVRRKIELALVWLAGVWVSD